MLISKNDLPDVVNAVLYVEEDGLKFTELRDFVNRFMSHKEFKTYELAHKIRKQSIFCSKKGGKYYFSGKEKGMLTSNAKKAINTAKAKWIISEMRSKFVLSKKNFNKTRRS